MKRLSYMAVLGIVLGCGGKAPQYTGQTKALFDRIDKQVTSKSLPALQQLFKQAEEMHDKKTMTDEQFAAIKKVADLCENQRWENAAEEMKLLKEGQGKDK